MKKFRVGLVGLGKMGRLHMLNCMKLENTSVVAAADPSERALRKARKMGVQATYTDYNEMIHKVKNLDAVIVSTPNFLHFDSIKAALENGINVFTEKPLAVNVSECQKIVDAVQSSGRKLMIGHNMRFVPAIEAMKRDLWRGHIGSLEVATIEEVINGPFSHPAVPTPVADWWFDPKTSGGGALIDIGYHMIDLFRFFTDEDARVRYSSLSHKFDLPVEEGAIVFLSSARSSVQGIINVGWYQRSIFPKYNFRAILHGNAGYLSTEDLAPRDIYMHAVKEGMKNILRRASGRRIRPLSYTYYYESYYKELEAFFRCLENDMEPPVTALDGLKTIEVIEESYKMNKETKEDD